MIGVDHPDRADTGGRKIKQRRRAQPTRTNDQHARIEQLLLPGSTDLAQNEVACVAFDLVIAQGHGENIARQRPIITPIQDDAAAACQAAPERTAGMIGRSLWICTFFLAVLAPSAALAGSLPL